MKLTGKPDRAWQRRQPPATKLATPSAEEVFMQILHGVPAWVIAAYGGREALRAAIDADELVLHVFDAGRLYQYTQITAMVRTGVATIPICDTPDGPLLAAVRAALRGAKKGTVARLTPEMRAVVDAGRAYAMAHT